MTCKDIAECKNCPIKDECDEADEFCAYGCDSRAFDCELLAKVYTKGREDAGNDLLKAINEKECGIEKRNLWLISQIKHYCFGMKRICDMEGDDNDNDG